jgi:hypothetical protein
MVKDNRDDFSRITIDILAKRVGYLCSNPDCRNATIGANQNEYKSTSIGIAAHITAASSGGARYNSELTSDQRSDIINGIWLCSNCATLIDKDPERYTVELLHEWKSSAETESRLKLSGEFRNKTSVSNSISSYNPILEVDLLGYGRSRSPRGMSMNNPTELYQGQLVFVPGNKPIIHWALGWRYKLVIYNNSSYSAYNLKIESIGEVQFSEFENLDNINNIAPLGNKDLKVTFNDWVESDHSVADEILRPRFPDKFNNMLILKLAYYDELRHEHISYVEFNNGEIINRKI